MFDLEGRALGDYKLLKKIGRGGMASVYKARDLVNDRIVAVKVLAPQLAVDPRFRARFERESQVLRGLKHPNIVPVLDYGEADGLAYIVMPFIKLGGLDRRLKIGPLEAKEGARIFNQVASALQYAHDQGVIHRDVKPSNIMLDEEGNALLSDFGFAHIHDSSLSLTGSAIIGTPAYMAPEQIRGQQVTSLSDQYSLGVVLYQISTGYLPYDAESPLAIAIKHATEPLPKPREVNPKLPDAIEAVLVKVLDKDPSRRFKSVTELNNAFQRSLHSAVDVTTGRLKPGAVSRAPTTEVYPLGAPGDIKPKRKVWHLKRSTLASLLVLVVALPLTVWLAMALNARNQGRVVPTALIRRAIGLGAASEVLPSAVSPTTGRRNVSDPSEDYLSTSSGGQVTETDILPFTGALSAGSPMVTLTAGSTPTIDSTAKPTTFTEASPSPTSTPFTSATSTLSLTPTIKLSPSITPTHSRTPTSIKTPTPSNTPTLTLTKAPSPTEDICANVSLSGFGTQALRAVWSLNNYSSVVLAIDSIYLDWPIKNQRLDWVTLSGAAIWGSGDEEPPTTVNGVGGMIMPGSSLEITFVFKRAAEVTGYELRVTTAGSCEVSSQG